MSRKAVVGLLLVICLNLIGLFWALVHLSSHNMSTSTTTAP